MPLFSRWILLGLAWFAFVMSYTSVNHCSFKRQGDPSLDYKSLDQLGLFKLAMYDPDHKMLGCINYDSRSEWDRNFKLARASAVLLVLALSVITISHTLSVLFLVLERRKCIILWVCRILAWFALLFNSMLFVVLGGEQCNSDELTCAPGAGAILSIFNEFAVFAMAVLFILIPPPTHPYLIRYSDVSDILNRKPFQNGNTFSVPETVKAKNTFEKRVDKASKQNNLNEKKKQQLQPEEKSYEGAIVLRNPSNQGNEREGSSSSTLYIEDLNDEENPKPSSRKYCAPKHNLLH